jgi:hypothetical protein
LRAKKCKQKNDFLDALKETPSTTSNNQSIMKKSIKMFILLILLTSIVTTGALDPFKEDFTTTISTIESQTTTSSPEPVDGGKLLLLSHLNFTFMDH